MNPAITCRRYEDELFPRASGTTVVPAYQRPGTGLIPGADDRPGALLDNEQVTNLARNLTDTTRAHAGQI